MVLPSGEFFFSHIRIQDPYFVNLYEVVLERNLGDMAFCFAMACRSCNFFSIIATPASPISSMVHIAIISQLRSYQVILLLVFYQVFLHDSQKTHF